MNHFKQKTISRQFPRFQLEEKEIVEVSAERGRHYQTPFGCFPSVTTVLSAKENPYLDEWRKRVGEEEANKVSREATNRGSLVHQLFEDYLRGKEVSFPHPTLKEHFLQAKPLLDQIEVVYANEIPLYSRHLKVAGRCDCIAIHNGELKVIDFKTSKHFKDPNQIDNYKMQCSAYIFMANEIYNLKIDKFAIIITNLYENNSSIFEGNAKDYIKDFWELRKQWDMISSNT